MQELIEDYLKTLSPSLQTALAYRSDLLQVAAALSQVGIEQWNAVSQSHLAVFLQQVQEQQNYRPATVARKLAVIKSFFRFLCAAGHIDSLAPIEDLAMPPLEKTVPSVLNTQQLDRIFHQVLIETPRGLRDLAMMQLLTSTGIRRSELVALDLGDLGATIRCTSRHGQRMLPLLPDQVVEAMQCYLNQARPHLVSNDQQQAVFVNHHGERLTRQGVWLLIKRYARQAGVVMSPQILRHTCALRLLKSGMPITGVQEELGYAHQSTLLKYHPLLLAERQPATLLR